MDQEPEGHPVATGLIALLGVGLVVGLLVSGGALAATRALGLSGGSADTGSDSQQSMYVPRPSPTDSPTGALVTLAPGQTASATDSATASATPQFQISLSAGQTTVSPMQRIDLSGVYPNGEGHVVQVQRFESGQWTDFSTVDAVVSNGTFSTYILTSRSGMNRFRVRDTDSDVVSNAVRVQVS